MVPHNIFKIFWNFLGHLINFPNLFTISEKNLLISPKISSLFSKLIQKFFKITVKFLQLRETFPKFSSWVLKIIFAKYTRKPFNIFSKFSLNPNKIFVKTLIEILLNLIKTDLKFHTLTMFKNYLITWKVFLQNWLYVSSEIFRNFIKYLQNPCQIFAKIPSSLF